MQGQIKGISTSAVLTVFIICAALDLFAQTGAKVLRSGEMQNRMWTVNFSDSEDELQISALKHQEAAPAPLMRSADIKAQLDAQRRRRSVRNKTSPYDTRADDIAPEINRDFNGKPVGPAGIPNDNTMAISNDGIIISAINTTVTILDEEGNPLKFRTLAGLVAGQLGLLDRYYDPKVIYDPIADRFILVFLEGSESSDTRIIVGFTQTSDPTGNWNFYQIDGRPLGGNTWSDYPIVAHNKEDLYITVNLLMDDGSWQDGFIQSFIWQISKNDGYEGDSLGQQLFYDIKYEGEPVWSICPVQPAEDFDSRNMYFLSVRPDAAGNDTVFLHEITNTLSSGQAEHRLSVLKTDIEYGVPPSAFQPVSGFRLQTNDARILSATLLRNQIHYVQSTLVTENLSSGVYHGIISDVGGNPSVSGQIISSESLDYAYPSISYSGFDKESLKSMLITFSHSGEADYPGTSLIFYNGLGNLEGIYSEPAFVKEGEGVINTFVADSMERWGDYTDLQRKYNEAGVVWLSGSYGDSNGLNNVWLAKVNVNNELHLIESIIIYPNPAHTGVRVAANFAEEGKANLYLRDMKGASVKELRDQQVRKGACEFILNTDGIAPGMYILSIFSDGGELLHSEKIVME